MTTTERGNPFFMIVDKTPINNLVDPKRALITINSTATLKEAMNLLTSSHISSCPVLDSHGKCLGSIDFLTVLKFLSQAHINNDYGHKKNEQNKNEELKSPLPSDSNLLKTLVSDLVPQCTHLQPYFVDAPVSHCINLMTKVHRVALYRKNFELFTTVSQSDVLRYLGVVINDVRTGKQYTQRYKRDVLDLCETQLSKLNVFHTPMSLQSTATIYDALELCIKCNYRVLSILNPNGQIIGDFCVDKLSSLQPYYDKTHQYTLQDWLTTINPIRSADVSCIDGDATYEQAILLMLSRKTHHLWAVDADIKPVFILTITDLFKVLEPIDLSSKESYDVELGQLWK